MDKNGLITLAHGSGGQSSHELMSEIFGKYFSNPILDRLEDAAVLPMGDPLGIETGTMAVSTDSFVVTPLFFPGGDIGKIAACGTVNDLLMMGAEPRYLTCGFILEEGLPLSQLDKICDSMKEQADQAGVIIVAGDTKVVDGRGGIYINTTGIGYIPNERNIGAANIKPGDAILLSGNLGEHQTAIYSTRLEGENDIESDCAVLKDVTDALYGAGVVPRAMRDVTRGGLGTILNELAQAAGCGMNIGETLLPITERVKSFADILGFDPLYMANEGKLVAIVREKDAARALSAMRQTEHGKNAALIGHVSGGRGVTLVTPNGGVRSVDVLYGEGLPRIC